MKLCTKRLLQLIIVLITSLVISRQLFAQSNANLKRQPNILFAIADDQSYPHTSAYGQKIYHTPNFDRVASKGVLFTNAFVAAPQCSPSRAAILTGRQIWQLDEAGTHASLFPKKYPVVTNTLESAGYFLGFTGKPWDPGNFKATGWTRNPVGPEYNNKHVTKAPTVGISNIDYVANFADFLSEKPADKPFFFWFGSHEPHRNYEPGSGAAAGLQTKDMLVPAFLPDNQNIRNDLLDYALEIEYFDKQLGKMLDMLAAAGELDNTIVVVTADNGMPFPYAKANLQEYGIHVPLAICGPKVHGQNRTVTDMVSLIDLAPTFLDLASAEHFKGITGKSLMPILKSKKSGNIDTSRHYVFSGRERHSHARPDNVGYPARAIRSQEYLYIENLKPDRWPAGDPAPSNPVAVVSESGMKGIFEGYDDIDDSPTKSWMIQNKNTWPVLFKLGFEKRNQDQLFNIIKDPNCLNDLATNTQFDAIRNQLKKKLEETLVAQSDPRMTGNGDLFDSYPRFGLMRPYEGFKERGKYNPAFQKKSSN